MRFLSELTDKNFDKNIRRTIYGMSDDIADARGGLSEMRATLEAVGAATAFIFDRLIEKGLVTDLEKKEYITWEDEQDDNTP